MPSRFIALLLITGAALSAAEFQDYQAARAVIGQPSFSSHDKGVNARSLSLANRFLFIADDSGQVITYDLSHVGITKTSCPVCLSVPQSIIKQNVFQGVAAVAVNGHRVAIADSKSHSVMIWSNSSSVEQPGVVISAFVNPTAVALDDQRLFVADAAAHHVYIWNSLPISDSQPPDVTLGNSGIGDSPAADTLQTPTALASDGVNLFVTDAAAHRVLIFSPADSPVPEITNAASLLPGPVAPGTIIWLDHPSSTNSTVLLNGTPITATETNGKQLQIQIPYDITGASNLWIKTELDDGSVSTSRPASLRITAVSPGIFAFGATEPRNGLILHSPAGVPLSPEDPAKPSELLTVWATGLGAVSSEANSDGAFDTLIPVRATIGGNRIEVISAVLPAEATGVYEVRIRVLSQLSPGAQLILFQNDSKSNAVTFPIAANPN